MSASITRRDFFGHCGRCVLLCATAASFSWVDYVPTASAQELKKGYIGRKLSPYFALLDDNMIRCTLCPNECEVAEGYRGICEVRENIGGKYYSLVYGNPCAVHLDPIEKKPFFHVLPGTKSFSLATAGCNFDCKFCQNWEISQARPDDTYNYALSPQQVVDLAKRYQCASIASTYVEPTIFFEYMFDIAKLAKSQKILKVMHSNGFINEVPLKELCTYLGAACIDLKGFSEDYYRKITEGHLQPVLDTLQRLKSWHVHVEIVNLVIPGKNDDPQEIRAMCRWIHDRLGPDVPLHFTRFYPRYKLKSIPPTPVSTLEKAHQLATQEGLRYVYIGNVPGHPMENTFCPRCKAVLIRRFGYQVKIVELKNGHCGRCGEPIPGLWR